MKKQKLLDLNAFFYNVRKIPYVIIKFNDSFPIYYKGQDIDIFCYDKGQFVQKLLEIGNIYVNKGFEIKVTNIGKGHSYIDFIFKNELHFRFDVCQELPVFKNIKIKNHYIYSVIENANTIQGHFGYKPYLIYIPSKIDDLLLRYIEYIEYYRLRPDKVKHLNYIMKIIRSDPQRIRFLSKLHLYTDLPDDFSKPVKGSFIQQIIKFAKKIIKLMIAIIK